MRLDRFKRLVKHFQRHSSEADKLPLKSKMGTRLYRAAHVAPVRSTRLRGGGLGSDRSIEDLLPLGGVEEVYDTDDEVNPSQFLEEEWIGCGRSWNISMPGFVKRQRNTARIIPPEVAAAVILPISSSVADLLAQPDPNTHVSAASSPSYSTTLSNLIIDVHDPIGFSTFLSLVFSCIAHHTRLRDTFNDAWLSGSRSITLSLHSVPLWTERLVADLRSYTIIYNRWSDASRWLSGLPRTTRRMRDLIEDCESIMEAIPYEGTVPGLSEATVLSTHDLSLFLSNEWINDEMINTGSQYILHQLGARNRRRIVNCLLVGSLKTQFSRSERYQPRHTSSLDHLISAGSLDKLLFPPHISGNHWTLLEIDLLAQTYSYADSLSAKARPPSSTLRVLEWWINQLSDVPTTPPPMLKCITPKFAIPHQRDSFSCGVVVLSTMANYLLNYTPWTTETYAEERMEWFIRISEYFGDMNGGSDVDDDTVSFRSLPSL